MPVGRKWGKLLSGDYQESSDQNHRGDGTHARENSHTLWFPYKGDILPPHLNPFGPGARDKPLSHSRRDLAAQALGSYLG
jgi:hypothetical protein